jgi:rhodanese-related sulfurtransferase
MKSALSCIFIFITLNIACGQGESKYNNISADSMKTSIGKKDIIILDVRSKKEFAEGHIPGAVNLNIHDENFEAALDTMNKEIRYDVYCRSGNRSGDAVEIMKKKNFKKVNHFDGGILEWKEKEYEIVK